MWRQSATHSHSLRRESKNAPWEFQTKHLGSLTAANWVSFDFNVAYSSRWDYSLINTLKLKKTQNYYIILFWAITKAIFTSLYVHFLQWVLRALWNRCSEHQCMCRYISSQMFFDIYVHICKHTRCRVCTYVYIHIYICICMHMYMDTYVRLWCCLTRWGVVAEIFYLCIGVHIHETLRRRCRNFPSVYRCPWMHRRTIRMYPCMSQIMSVWWSDMLLSVQPECLDSGETCRSPNSPCFLWAHIHMYNIHTQ